MVHKYFLDESKATVLGHQKQEMSNLQTSKVVKKEQEDFYSASPIPNVRQQEVAYKVIKETELAFIDLTGRFP